MCIRDRGLSGSVEDLAYAKSLYENANPTTAAQQAVDVTRPYLLREAKMFVSACICVS